MNIREIEHIIDHAHDQHPIFQRPINQVVYELLSVFEDTCRLFMMESLLNPAALMGITAQMDALNTALLWTYDQCDRKEAHVEIGKITEDCFNQCISLLNEYALPYSNLCSAYIAFSRKRLTAEIDDKQVTFNIPPKQNNSMWSDILREVNSDSPFGEFMGAISHEKLRLACTLLQETIEIEEGFLVYRPSNDVWEEFKNVASLQWEASKTLPKTWKFDGFSLEEYRKFWVALATLCYIHFFACISISDPLERISNSTIIQKKADVVRTMSQLSGIDESTTKTIIEYIAFDPTKKNVDIMYQPIVELQEDILVIAPALIMGSRPERNLLSVVSSSKDHEYSKEVNDLEDLMIDELETVVGGLKCVEIAKRKKLEGTLPDVDFCIFDKTSDSILIVELKWFAPADSAKEVFAKEDEITHGCEQMEAVMGYALRDKVAFMRRIFGSDVTENLDVFCCVAAKHNIRTQNNHVPVIDFKKLTELLSRHTPNDVFHMIRNHEYEITLPDNASIDYSEVDYCGFHFRIPAIVFDTTIDIP